METATAPNADRDAPLTTAAAADDGGNGGLSSLLQIHGSLQQRIRAIAVENAAREAANNAIVKEIAEIESECRAFDEDMTPLAKMKTFEASCNAEQAALNQLDRRATLIEKRIGALLIRVSAARAARVKQQEALIVSATQARTRIPKSYEKLQTNKRLHNERVAEIRSEAIRTQVEFQQLEEEQTRLQNELDKIRELLRDVSQGCNKHMEVINREMQARRSRATVIPTSPPAHTPTHRSATHSVKAFPGGFDPVRAFRDQQQHRQQLRASRDNIERCIDEFE